MLRVALRFWPEQFERSIALEKLAGLLHSQFESHGSISDLNEAISLARNALELRPQGHPRRILSLGHLATYLRSRFTQLGVLSDLNEALAFARNALELDPQRDLDRAYSLEVVALCLFSRFSQLGTLSDLDEALTLERNALELYPQEHPLRACLLENITSILYSRFNQLGMLPDLEEALAFARSSLKLRPQGHPRRANSLENIANILYSRFTLRGMLSDLNEALSLERNVLILRPPGHPRRPGSLGNIANILYSRFTQLGTLSDLDEALALGRNALELCPQGHPPRSTALQNIAFYLYSRFTQLGTLSDLNEALVLERNLLELLPQGHPHRATSLGHIANCLHSRFHEFGLLSDLDEALDFARDALELCPLGHPGRAASLGHIASCLHSRFMQLGTPSDNDEALGLERSALELYPQEHPHRATSLSKLATYYDSRFALFGSLSDLDEALALGRTALELRPQGHPDRVHSLENVGVCLYRRFTRLNTLSNLDEALTLHRNVLELLPQGHPGRATALRHIANCLHSRFAQLGSLDNLDEAIVLARDSLELCPQEHPYRACALQDLATYLHARFKCQTLRDISDLQESFSLYSQLSQSSQAVSRAYRDCASRWIQAAEECQHKTTVLAYETYLRLSVHHLATLPSLPQHLPSLKHTTTSTAVDAFSACIRYGQPGNAVELLEQGRGVFWSQLIRLRSPLDDVISSGETGKELAEKFMRVVSLLRTVLDAPLDAESQHDRACRLTIQLQDIVTEIRKLPSLSRFLEPPLFSDLRNAASGGPVIIVNASQYTCDALIVLPDKDPVHVALPVKKAHVSDLSMEFRSVMSRARFRDVKMELLVLLRRLWDMVVFPIVKILQELCPRGSRIWWCPTAEFCHLPLHAAGSFRKGQPMFSDLYISSYTPTLAALIRARKKQPVDPSMDKHRFLVVGQAQAPGHCKLASVNTELSTISQCIGSVATLTCVQDQDATTAKVAEELQKHEFVHLACHGIPEQKRPFESGFALGDGLLKVDNLMRYDLQNAQFAYLSACHTTVGDEESPDEVIHLAAAVQFAGFRSVIGTMWAVDDAHTNEITSKFYEYMVDESGRLDHTRAALALHKTMRSLRSSKIPIDQRILYVHIGA